MAIATAPTVEASAPPRNAYDVLQERGFIYQCSDEVGLRRALNSGPLTFYGGFDPTADSLHLGNLVGAMGMAHLQRAGHRAIALVGGGTTMIGDPTDRTSGRRIMSRKEIDANAQVFKRQLAGILDFSETPEFPEGRGIMVDNADWLLALNYIEFLRDYGRYFSVNEMLRMETYRSRLETGLTFLEFNYALLQAYDFLELYRRYGCLVQVGGSDQWSNVLAGAHLIQRAEQGQAFALTWPLLMDTAGSKMGKSSASGQVWLSPHKTSPYDFYQHFINVDDAAVAQHLAIFTFLPLDEIRDLTSAEGEALRPAKERLAFEVTRLAHGEAEAQQAQATSRALFGRRDATFQAATMRATASMLPASMAGEVMPTTEIAAGRLEAGISAVDLLVEAGLAQTRNRARQLVEQGGAYVNDERLALSRTITTADLRDGALLLRKGKKQYQRVVMKVGT
ncbi:MAG: tyrosine--tRNA ligase [Chloroflexota bacterium]